MFLYGFTGALLEISELTEEHQVPWSHKSKCSVRRVLGLGFDDLYLGVRGSRNGVHRGSVRNL